MLHLLILVALQSGALAVDVKLAVPAGVCAPVLNGTPVTMDALKRATAEWQANHATVEFAPDPKAEPACMQQVLRILQDAGAGDRFPLTVTGDDLSGVEDE